MCCRSTSLLLKTLCLLSFSAFTAAAENAAYTAAEARQFVTSYCAGCHHGKSPAGGLDLPLLLAGNGAEAKQGEWERIAMRVRNREMPPSGAPAPEADTRERFAGWIEAHTKAACSSVESPAPPPLRRLNRSEYTATVRDLLDIHLDVGHALPADGAGGEGFDNAAETLFLSPVHAEKYLEAARLATETLSRDASARAKLLVVQPGDGVTEIDAARRTLEEFLPRAFRRPVDAAEVAPYLSLFSAARKSGSSYDDAILYAVRGVLISPQFLFHIERQSTAHDAAGDYALASRLSYFLWGSMPDSLLFDLAAAGKLHDPDILRWQVGRMLRSPKSTEFATRFVEQWLGTRELGRTIQPDPMLFPMYADDELRSDIRYQPIMFFRELLVHNLSLLNLIDSKFTIATRKLQKLYGLNVKPPRPDAGGQPQRIELPEGSHRGGLLGMSAVLIASSYPHRTSPVLRGKWVLDAMLGTPPPPPPPDVPSLPEKKGAAPKSVRKRLEEHRANPACAGCHATIDPIGFALENYDPIGRWRTEDDGAPVDASGKLPDGTEINGPDELKASLLARKQLFLRHLTSKMLGYALGRGLTRQDKCVVDGIVAQLERDDYKAQTLVNAIVFSPAFQFEERSNEYASNSH